MYSLLGTPTVSALVGEALRIISTEVSQKESGMSTRRVDVSAGHVNSEQAASAGGATLEQ